MASGFARARGKHERGIAGNRYDGVRIFACFKQRLDDRGIAVRAGQRERGDAESIGGFDVGAGADQEVGDFEIVMAGSPVKRGCAIGLRDVHIHLLTEERAHGGVVRGHGGIGETRVGSGMHQRSGE